MPQRDAWLRVCVCVSVEFQIPLSLTPVYIGGREREGRKECVLSLTIVQAPFTLSESLSLSLSLSVWYVFCLYGSLPLCWPCHLHLSATRGAAVRAGRLWLQVPISVLLPLSASPCSPPRGAVHAPPSASSPLGTPLPWPLEEGHSPPISCPGASLPASWWPAWAGACLILHSCPLSSVPTCRTCTLHHLGGNLPGGTTESLPSSGNRQEPQGGVM